MFLSPASLSPAVEALSVATFAVFAGGCSVESANKGDEPKTSIEHNPVKNKFFISISLFVDVDAVCVYFSCRLIYLFVQGVLKKDDTPFLTLVPCKGTYLTPLDVL